MINIKKNTVPDGEHYTDKKLKKVTKKRLKEEFYNLCYVCEYHCNRGSEIDHFYPKGEEYFPEKINDWDNLFLICGTCNKIRPKNINTKTAEEVYNNCKDDVENLIELRYNAKNERIEIKSKENSVKAENTINLLERVYNGKGSESDEHQYLRIEIKNKLEIFREALDNFTNLTKPILKKSYKKKVVEFITKEYNLKEKVFDSNKFGFVSFKRQIIKDDNKYKQFKTFFD